MVEDIQVDVALVGAVVDKVGPMAKITVQGTVVVVTRMKLNSHHTRKVE